MTIREVLDPTFYAAEQDDPDPVELFEQEEQDYEEQEEVFEDED